MNKACFIDRDGVLIKEEHYLSDPDKVTIIPGVPEALKLLEQRGYMRIVVSNQAGVARGYFQEKAIYDVEKRIRELLKNSGCSVDDWYYCPHYPKGKVQEYAIDCECRKPAPGMILKAAKEHAIDLAQSFLVGDKISDIKAGEKAGCGRNIIVRTGHGDDELKSAGAQGLIIAENFYDAVMLCLRHQN